jgi:hypothetical protein
MVSKWIFTGIYPSVHEQFAMYRIIEFDDLLIIMNIFHGKLFDSRRVTKQMTNLLGQNQQKQQGQDRLHGGYNALANKK